MSTPPGLTAILNPSEIGSKEYWSTTYSSDLGHYTEDPTPEHTGTEWFSEHNTSQRMLSYLEKSIQEFGLNKQLLVHEGWHCEPSTFLDVGSGNGHLLQQLRDAGWHGKMVGVDYVEQAVELARMITGVRQHDVRKKSISGEDGEVDRLEVHKPEFYTWDVMGQEPGEWMPHGGFDVVLDKGTFDAISLSSATLPGKDKRMFEAYPSKVETLVKRNGILLVASCNWTADELKIWFENGTYGNLICVGKVEGFRTFKFAGKEGGGVCCLCFRRQGARNV